MKNKYIKLAALLIGLNVNAQINIQAPTSVSISKENPFLDASGYNTFQNSIGKGLYFPRTDLTTWEFKLNSITPSSFSTYFDGMIVYNSGSGQTIQDAKKGGKRVNVTPGFYYFKNPGQNFPSGNVSNGQWVRLGTEDFNELWDQRNVNGVTETYLKPATANGDEYMYSPKKSYINLGNVSFDDLARPWIDPNPTPANPANLKERTPHLTIINNSAFNTKDTSEAKYFSRDIYNVNAPITGGAKKSFTGKDFWTTAKDVNANVDGLIGVNSETDFMSSKELRNLVGGRFASRGGSEKGHAPNVDRNISLRTRTITYAGKTKTMIGILNEPTVIGGQVENMFGEQTSLYSTEATNGVFPNLNLKYMIGNRMTLLTQPNTTSERTYGAIFYNYFKNNSTISKEAVGVVTSGYFEDGSNVKDYSGFTAYLNGVSNTTVDKIHGYLLLTSDLQDNFETREMYGIYLANVNKGKEKNFAIYTNEGTVRFGDKVGVGVDNPAEKLEVKGAVKISNSTKDTCDGTNAGTIRFKGNKFQGCTGTAWVDLH